MKVAITGIVPVCENEFRIRFTFSDGENACTEDCVISVLHYAGLLPKVGEVSREQYEEIAWAAKVYEAKKYCQRALAYSRCSEKMLIRKAVMKGFERDAATAAVRELCRDGYINTQDDVMREAERGIGRYWGERRIAMELIRKGYPEDAVRFALREMRDSGVDYVENCMTMIRRRSAEVPENPQEYRKMVASLERYGYTLEEIRAACKRLKRESR